MDKQYFGELTRLIKKTIVTALVIVSFGELSCAQNEKIIFKRRQSSDTEHFPSVNYICQKKCISGKGLVYKVEFLPNGWQVRDSVTIFKDSNLVCYTTYRPNYDLSLFELTSYVFQSKTCIRVSDQLKILENQHGLLDDYTAALVYLFSKNPLRTGEKLIFSDGLIPSLFTEYGIPVNQTLNAFLLNVENGLLMEDSFLFENFNLARRYYYSGGVLDRVVITLADTNGRHVNQFTETFEFQ